MGTVFNGRIRLHTNFKVSQETRDRIDNVMKLAKARIDAIMEEEKTRQNPQQSAKKPEHKRGHGLFPIARVIASAENDGETVKIERLEGFVTASAIPKDIRDVYMSLSTRMAGNHRSVVVKTDGQSAYILQVGKEISKATFATIITLMKQAGENLGKARRIVEARKMQETPQPTPQQETPQPTPQQETPQQRREIAVTI